MTHLPENRALSYINRDVSCENRALSYINRDVNYKVPEDRALSYKNRDVSCENRALSYINRDVSSKDSYLLFRNKYLISNVVNSRPESARPLHSYLIKVQGTTIIGMLDSGAQINCVSQHIVQKHKFPVYLYDTPLKLGMAIEGEKYEVTSYTEIPYKIAQYSGKLSLSVLPSVSGFDIILGLPWLQTVNPLIPNWSTGDLFITRRKVNGKIDTYRCKSIPTRPFSIPENCPSQPIAINQVPCQKAEETIIFCIWVQSTEYFNVHSLAMEEAARKATSFAQHQMEDDFYQPAFEEPPLYKESIPHTPEQQIIIDQLIADNCEVLRDTLPPGIPPARPGDHPIAPTIPGSAPVSKPPYKLSPAENTEVKRQLQEYLDKGFLVPSHSSWGAPVFLVKKAH